MSARQWKRLDAVRSVEARKMSMREAARALGLSRRQMRRLCVAVAARGQAAVVHGNTGRAPWNRTPASVREKVVELAREKYAGFNDQHLSEKLVGCEGIERSRQTVRRLLREAGIGPVHRRRRPQHHRRRDRKPQAGQMVLWDGSRHEWLEGRGPVLCLMGAIDDATGEVLPGIHFVEQECAASYLRLLRGLVQKRGVPWAIYMDRHGALKRVDDFWTLEEELKGRQEPTHVGAALEELGIEAIYALSAQAKGRVERLWGTLQDRLTSELRLAGAKTLEQANAVLQAYLPGHNRHFSIAASESQPAWLALRAGQDLERICAFRYPATVQNDNTVRLAGMVIDIPPGPGRRSYAKARVDVRQLLDGTWKVYLHDHLVATRTGGAEEVAPRRVHRRSAAQRAFGRSIKELASGRPRCGNAGASKKRSRPQRQKPAMPFNTFGQLVSRRKKAA